MAMKEFLFFSFLKKINGRYPRGRRFAGILRSLEKSGGRYSGFRRPEGRKPSMPSRDFREGLENLSVPLFHDGLIRFCYPYRDP